MSFIDPKAPIMSYSHARHFISDMCVDGGSMYSLRGVQDGAFTPDAKKLIDDLMPKAQAEYKARLLNHSLCKGIRPWELVNCVSDNDPNEIWIGVEWETGFASRNEFKAAVQYLWTHHNNWAIDAEGIGPHYGEFTFPPVDLDKWIEGKSMMDSLRRWMASKNIVTPRIYREIDYKDSGHNKPRNWELDEDATDGWGCHVNISVPMTRTSRSRMTMMGCVINWLNARMDDMSYIQQLRLFGRNPYGYGGTRSNLDGTDWWWEWKLFRTPVTDEEMENIRAVSTKLALLLGEYTTRPEKYFYEHHNGGSSFHSYRVRVPTTLELYNYLSGESDLSTSDSTAGSVYDSEYDGYFFPDNN